MNQGEIPNREHVGDLLRKLGKQPSWAAEAILISKLQHLSVKWDILEGNAHKIHERM